MNKNIAIFALVMLTLGTVATYSAPSVLADWLIDRSGTLIQVDSNVLGDDDVKTEAIETPKPESLTHTAQVQQEQLNKQEELKNETTKNQIEQIREVAKKQLERKIELNKKLNKNVENKFEITAKGGELQVKQKSLLQNGTEKVTDLKIKENETLHIDQQNGESVDIDASKPGELEITKDKFKGHTRLPISVDSNNELIVTRPDGTTKVVTVLPDQAVTKMLDKGILVQSDNVELTTDATGNPVYQAKQEVSKKILGFIPMNFGQETTVSASDPNQVTTTSTEVSPWRRFLERLAR